MEVWLLYAVIPCAVLMLLARTKGFLGSLARILLGLWKWAAAIITVYVVFLSWFF